jgi:putative colanic acid biosynthesis acetyltransferase WcaF
MRTEPVSFRNPHSLRSRVARLLWSVTWMLLFRPTPWFMGAWRSWLLRRFGARLGFARFNSSTRVWAPWLLETGDHVYVDDRVNLYNPFGIRLASRVIISQGSFLCSATHDYTDPSYPLTGAQIAVQEDSWIAADAFIGPGVTIGPGTVVGARAVVVKDAPPWTVVAGNPARVIKQREVAAQPKAELATSPKPEVAAPS